MVLANAGGRISALRSAVVQVFPGAAFAGALTYGEHAIGPRGIVHALIGGLILGVAAPVDRIFEEVDVRGNLGDDQRVLGASQPCNPDFIRRG